MNLSKSDYMLFLRHPAWLWLKKYQKDKLLPVDENTQAIFDAGHDFEGHAEELFLDAVKLGFSDYGEYVSLPTRTAAALNAGVKIILQGRFEAEGITCVFDVLDRVSEDTFDLIEIKSSTKVKPEHEYDLAFQLEVLRRAGMKVRNISVIHVNCEYVREGNIDPVKITEKTDVTGAVHALAEITQEQIKKAFEVLSQSEMPDISPRHANQLGISNGSWFSEWMSIYKSLNPSLDPYSIYSLCYPNAEQIAKLEDAGITLLKDIPEDLCLRPKQIAQVKTTRDNTRIFEKERIKEFLSTFQYPLYFFDYETFSSVIPDFDGLSPYKDYPFQYSLHVIDSPGGEARHTEYLHQERSNPMPKLLEKLKQDIGDHGTVLTWNMSYEKGCNDRMCGLHPEYKEFLESLNGRVVDLMTPFSNMWFFDKDFFGSASVKNVLPVLCPELNHKDLDVSDGMLARRLWMDTFLGSKNQDRKDEIANNLCEYCTLDTFAMVRILEELEKVCGE
ncbi:DUF2779 domain-containing protein [Candidatus Microgenomates bacterium]|nr:MAG: DUF2779 domain-containing protein [Candidatus Microgenomates bacterium]